MARAWRIDVSKTCLVCATQTNVASQLLNCAHYLEPVRVNYKRKNPFIFNLFRFSVVLSDHFVIRVSHSSARFLRDVLTSRGRRQRTSGSKNLCELAYRLSGRAHRTRRKSTRAPGWHTYVLAPPMGLPVMATTPARRCRPSCAARNGWADVCSPSPSAPPCVEHPAYVSCPANPFAHEPAQCRSMKAPALSGVAVASRETGS